MPKEYIEREAFIEILKETKNDCKHYADKVCCDFAIRTVNLMPTADVQEVRHGKWTKNNEHINLTSGKVAEWTNFYCSECDVPNTFPEKYCPNCGKKMINFRELKERKK